MRAVLVRLFPLCGLLSALVGGAVPAEELPRSPACRTAVQALDDAEAAIAAAAVASAPDAQRRYSVVEQLRPLRQRVADACLGGMTTSPPPSQHTWAVPAAPRSMPLSPPRSPAPAQALGSEPLLRWEHPVSVTHCSGATCTASDGSTLTRVGPTLVGPRGACTLQGSFLRCP